MAFSSEHGEPVCIYDWPGQEYAGGVTYAKMPTVISIVDGQPTNIGWAAILQVSNSQQRDLDSGRIHLLTHFKLLLSPRSAPSMQLPEGHNGRTLITFYLRQLIATSLIRIEHALGRSLDKKQDIEWYAIHTHTLLYSNAHLHTRCFTVPAIWDEAAKHMMYQCARSAGLRHPRLFLEPEAASLYISDRYGFSQNTPIMMVTDCGGGTIDIVTHRMSQQGETVEEICAGTGRVCGGVYVDRQFELYMAQRLGPVFLRFKAQHPVEFLFLLKEWETQKRMFGHLRQRDDVHIPLPHSLVSLLVMENQLDDPEDVIISISYDDMKNIFKPIIRKIVDSIRSSIEECHRRSGKTVTHIGLVGGFAGSGYLQQVIRQRVSRAGISVVVPEDPGAAVMHGALLLAQLESSYLSRRISRYTYGIEADVIFQPGHHRPDKVVIDPMTQQPSAQDAFLKFVSAGDAVPVNHVVQHSFYPSFPGQSELGIRIFRCSHPNPIHTDDYDSQEEATLVLELPPEVQRHKAYIAMRFGREQIQVTVQTKHGYKSRGYLSFARIVALDESES